MALSISKNPIFWVIFSAITCISILLGFRYFSSGMPLINIDISINQHQASKIAEKIATDLKLFPTSYKQAVGFLTDPAEQYVEVEFGNNKLTNMIKNNDYNFFMWHIRHFNELNPHEHVILLTPQGAPLGFYEITSDDQYVVELSEQEARTQAIQLAQNYFKIDLTNYELLKVYQEKKATGRKDYLFQFKRTHFDLGQSSIFLNIRVSGNKVTSLQYSIDVPGEFRFKAHESQSINTAIAQVGILLTFFLCIIGGCIIGLYFLQIRRFILWRPAFIWGFIVATINALSQLNDIPISFLSYPTSKTIIHFIGWQIFSILLWLLIKGILFTIIFAAAEGLTRAAFTFQPQFWLSWKPKVASSWDLLGRTIGAYFLAFIDFTYKILFYLFTIRSLGWWMPSVLANSPNALATPFPWISALGKALQAGFVEECIYRGILIGGAALIGQRLGYRKTFIGIAILAQAIIFSLAHANYAIQPFYGRIIELFFVALIMGIIYLRYGLIFTIITHVTYDTISFGLPVFISNAAGEKSNEILMILVLLIPLWVVLRSRLKTGSWANLKPYYFNAIWQPLLNKLPLKLTQSSPHEPIIAKPFNKEKYILSTILALIGLGSLAAFTYFKHDALYLSLTRNEAVKTAQSLLNDQKIAVDTPWKAIPNVLNNYTKSNDSTDQIGIFRKSPDLYHQLLGTYLQPPSWIVKFINFSSDMNHRTEEYQVYLTRNGKLYKLNHNLYVEPTSYKPMSEKEAQELATKFAQTYFNIDPAQTDIAIEKNKETSFAHFAQLTDSGNQEKNFDWLITFNSHKKVHQELDTYAEVKIVGNTITQARQDFYHNGTLYSRTDDTPQDPFAVDYTSLLILLCICMIIIIIHLHYEIPFALYFFIFLLLFGINVINIWPTMLAQFDTANPFYLLLAISLREATFIPFVFATLMAFAIGCTISWKKPYIVTRYNPFIIGSFLGLFFAGLMMSVQWIFSHTFPLWPSYKPMNAYLPWLRIIIENLLNYFTLTAAILLIFIIADLITHYGQKRKLFGFIFFIVAALVVFKHSLISYLLGIVGWLIYQLLGRYDFHWVPIAAGIIIVTQNLQQALFNAFPYAAISYIAASLLVLITAYYFTFKLRTTTRNTVINVE